MMLSKLVIQDLKHTQQSSNFSHEIHIIFVFKMSNLHSVKHTSQGEQSFNLIMEVLILEI